MPDPLPYSRSALLADTQSESALAPFARAARAHLKLIAVVTAIAVAACAAWLATRAQKYEASAQILVTPLVDAGNYTGLPVLTTSVDPTRTLQTAASIISSSQAAARTAQSLPGTSRSQVEDAVKVEPQGESDVLTVTATAGTGDRAAQIANTYAKTALALRRAELQKAVASSVADIRQRQAALPADSSGPVASELAGELTDLQRIEGGQDPNFSLLAQATGGNLAGASDKLLIVLSIVLGLIIGLVAAVIVEYLNRRVRDEDELQTIYPLPVLARVPPLPVSARDATAPEMVPPRVVEAFRTLHVQLDAETGAGRTIMFTSPSKGDGKTTSTINFALTLVRTGARVVLLDLDLRKPDVSRRFGVSTDLADLFGADARLEDVLRSVPGAPGLKVVSAQPRQDVTPLLEAVVRRIDQLVAQAHEIADYVIIDTAPLGEVSDALRFAAAVDDVILVVRPGHTDRGQLQHVHEVLEHTAHRPSGLVVVGGSEDRRDVYSGYGHDGASGRSGAASADAWDDASSTAPPAVVLEPETTSVASARRLRMRRER